MNKVSGCNEIVAGSFPENLSPSEGVGGGKGHLSNQYWLFWKSKLISFTQ